jgi:hypothetical protein
MAKTLNRSDQLFVGEFFSLLGDQKEKFSARTRTKDFSERIMPLKPPDFKETISEITI